MKRTFGGWLLRYCRHLSGLNTTSVAKFARACAASPHAAEAVMLYALDRGEAGRLRNCVTEGELLKSWRPVFDLLDEGSHDVDDGAESFMRLHYDGLPVRYKKVLDAYDAIEQERENDLRVKEEMAQRVVEELSRSGCTRYRLCQDLHLNKGNVYAWLSGDPTKVSRSCARRIWRYVQTL